MMVCLSRHAIVIVLLGSFMAITDQAYPLFFKKYEKRAEKKTKDTPAQIAM